MAEEIQIPEAPVFTREPAVPEPPRKKSYTWLVILILFLLAAGLSFFAWESYRLKNQLGPIVQSPAPQISPSILPLPETSPSATPVATLSAIIPEDWLTYTNGPYGFTLNYPPNFKALTDSENLYGWPKAVVLFYSGGQSYDLPVEVWNSEAEYKQKYPSPDVTVYKQDNKFITLVNVNKDPVVGQIISSFKLVE